VKFVHGNVERSCKGFSELLRSRELFGMRELLQKFDLLTEDKVRMKVHSSILQTHVFALHGGSINYEIVQQKDDCLLALF
jgi:hypothetical protein